VATQYASSNRGDPKKVVIAQNKKARYDYTIQDVFEAGMVLVGTEVKSLRQGRASLVDAYAYVQDGEVWLSGVHIPEYTQGTWTNHAPRRTRKLLLNRKEIDRLVGDLKQSGQALVPLSLYFLGGRVKVELGLGKGRKAHDKRQVMAERDAAKEIRNAMGREAKTRVRSRRSRP
jgi:SsrA-binding protein